eukprot:scaffold1901_cov26-Tisochrysis_lutea.AAC.4
MLPLSAQEHSALDNREPTCTVATSGPRPPRPRRARRYSWLEKVGVLRTTRRAYQGCKLAGGTRLAQLRPLTAQHAREAARAPDAWEVPAALSVRQLGACAEPS